MGGVRLHDERLMDVRKMVKKGGFWLLHCQMDIQMGIQNTKKTNGFEWV